MKRKALLIGAAYHDPEIPGVYDDIELWRSFLTSPVGGWWESNEISVLIDPDTASVTASIKDLSLADYALIIFAGLGETVKLSKPWRETLLHLGPHAPITDSDLNPGSHWVSMIMDCCRGVDNLVESIGFSTIRKSAAASPINLKARYRELFDQSINEAEKGLVQIFAASEGEYADDEKSFTRQLLDWTGRYIPKKSGVLFQNTAVAAVSELMKKETPQQHPEYKAGRRLHHLPIAVNVL